MRLNYRLHTEADEPALVRLWCEHAGFDRMDAATWAHRLRRTPLGEAVIVVAADADTDKVVGQFAFIPSMVSVGGRLVSAARPFAPVLADPARGSVLSLLANPFGHPVAAMYQHAVRALRERGHALTYMVPDPNWLRFFRLFPSMRCGSFPLWSRPLPLPAPLPLGPGYTAGPLAPADGRVDALWEKASRLHGCLVLRNSAGLPWKVSHGGYAVLGVERGGELVGLVASLAKGDRQWLVCDLLAADAGLSLRATLAAAANLAHARALAAPPDAPLRKVAVLVTAALEPAARDLGFARDAYDFPLVVHILDPALAADEVAPRHWYVSAND
jgi:hypothetical protein